jgi:hypothetical protein
MKDMKVFKNGKMTSMSYEEVCEDLGFNPSSHYVKITPHGEIGSYAGKPQERNALIKKVLSKGYKAAFFC